MGATNKEHRPLVSGTWITTAKRIGGNLQPITRGTLTGAARKPDGTKVLITNLHVLTGSGQTDATGIEEMYQEDVPLNVLLGSWSTYVPTPSKKVGDTSTGTPTLSGTDQIADVAMVELESGVDAKFQLHDYFGRVNRKILSDAKDPVENDKNPMRLTMLGARRGEGTVTVKRVGWSGELHNVDYAGLTIIDASQRPSEGGDSGSPLLYYDTQRNGYRMSCIAFAKGSDGRTVFAFPASVAETALGVKFGNSPPVAKARASAERVRPGDPVVLDGSGSRDPDGFRLSYKWRQLGALESPGTPQVTIVGSNDATASFTAPIYSGALSFQLTVTDSEGEIDTATVTVKVRPPISLAQWNDSGKTRGCGPTREKRQFRLEKLVPKYRWVSAPEEEVWSEWTDTQFPPRNETASEWEDAGETRIYQGTLKKKQTRILRWEKKQKRTSHCNSTQYRWDRKTRTDTRWEPVSLPPLAPQLPPIPTPTPSAWEDCDPLEYRGCGPTREKKQCRVNDGVTEYQWVVAPEELVWTEWADTGDTRNSDTGAWSDDGSTRGCGPDKEKRQSRTISREKEQESTHQCGGSKTQWVSTTAVTQTQWVSAPEQLIWTLWTDTGETRNSGTGSWTDDGRTRGCGPNREKRQRRTISREKKQRSTNQCGGSKTKWVPTTSRTEYQWVSDSEPYVWRTVNDGSPTTTYTAWSNLGEPYLSGSSCKQVQIRQSTTVQRRKQVNHCNDGVERSADPVRTTRNYRQVITVTETWGNWSYTGATHYDDIEDVMYCEQERFSSPCNRRQTQWVTTRP